MDLQNALYRRNNAGSPCVWYAEIIDRVTLKLHYGILGKTITTELVTSFRRSSAELESRIATKRKTGYKYLSEVKDNVILPVEEIHTISYLEAYLPYNRDTADGALLPMLAKLYDNKDDKLFRNNETWIIQPKINGLRCFIGAKRNQGDMFKPVKLIFQSREGTYWNSLDHLEDYLLTNLPAELINLMIENNYILDGELYLYGYAVNEINHFVKDPKDSNNKLLQYWCYDIAILEMCQKNRLHILDEYIGGYTHNITTENHHKNINDRLVYVEYSYCTSHTIATNRRDMYIRIGFEGLIGRDPDKEYQYGKRNSAMWKYKKVTDGIFTIVNIKPEGIKRPDIPLLVLKNDINDATFSVHITGSFEYQKSILNNTERYLQTKVIVEYGERSGVEQLPFHVKTVTFVEE